MTGAINNRKLIINWPVFIPTGNPAIDISFSFSKEWGGLMKRAEVRANHVPYAIDLQNDILHLPEELFAVPGSLIGMTIVGLDANNDSKIISSWSSCRILTTEQSEAIT